MSAIDTAVVSDRGNASRYLVKQHLTVSRCVLPSSDAGKGGFLILPDKYYLMAEGVCNYR